MSDQQLAAVTEGLAYAMRPLKEAMAEVTAKYALGPRGAWIMTLIEMGYRFPMDFARALRVRSSLVSAELTYLTRAGLVAAVISALDRRRSEFALTDQGRIEHEQVKEKTARLIRRNLSGYSSGDIDLFARMLRDVSLTENEESVLHRGTVTAQPKRTRRR